MHLWFDREVTTLPHATLLDRTMQWMFNKEGGRYLLLVVSASRELTGLSRADIIDMAVGDLRLYFPGVLRSQPGEGPRGEGAARHVLRGPGTEALRPPAETGLPNVYPGRRLDPHRLARHHGGRGAQRIPGRRGGGARRRPARASSCCPNRVNGVRRKPAGLLRRSFLPA